MTNTRNADVKQPHHARSGTHGPVGVVFGKLADPFANYTALVPLPPTRKCTALGFTLCGSGHIALSSDQLPESNGKPPIFAAIGYEGTVNFAEAAVWPFHATRLPAATQQSDGTTLLPYRACVEPAARVVLIAVAEDRLQPFLDDKGASLAPVANAYVDQWPLKNVLPNRVIEAFIGRLDGTGINARYLHNAQHYQKHAHEIQIVIGGNGTIYISQGDADGYVERAICTNGFVYSPPGIPAGERMEVAPNGNHLDIITFKFQDEPTYNGRTDKVIGLPDGWADTKARLQNARW